MTQRDELLLELEQHQVKGILHWFTLDRRDFLRVFGGGLLVCAAAPSVTVAQESGRRGGQQQLPKDLSSKSGNPPGTEPGHPLPALAGRGRQRKYCRPTREESPTPEDSAQRPCHRRLPPEKLWARPPAKLGGRAPLGSP